MNFTKMITDGLWGFAVFFTIILIVKLSLFLLGYSTGLNIEVIDIYQSLIGFGLFMLNSVTKKIVKQS